MKRKTKLLLSDNLLSFLVFCSIDYLIQLKKKGLKVCKTIQINFADVEESRPHPQLKPLFPNFFLMRHCNGR